MVGRRRKQQKRPSPFINHVLLPGLRSTILALAVLAIGFGSWLETTPGIDDCSFKRQMAMRQVSLYRNLTDNDNLPDTVSFGLWRHCFIYALNCTCTSPSLSYGLDATTILQGAFSNTTTLPTTDATTSYWNSVPLIMATALSATAFLFGVVINILNRRRLQLVNAGMVLASLILTAIAFGHTYSQYSHDIQQACEQYGRRCVSMDHGAEFIALVLGIALLGVACLTWVYAPKKDNDPNATTAVDTTKAPSSFMQQGGSSSASPRTPSDVLEPWREAALLDDERQRWTRHTSYQPIHDNEAAGAFTTEPLPPPPPGRRRTSRTMMDYYDLVPPSRPFAPNHSSSSPGPRRSSHGSGNTFGADNIMNPSSNRGSRTSSTMLESPIGGGTAAEDMYYHYNSSGSHSPTSRSHRRQSSGALTSSFGQQQRRRSQSPFRSSPGGYSSPSNNNNRTITDQRISAYLQRQDQAHLS